MKLDASCKSCAGAGARDFSNPCYKIHLEVFLITAQITVSTHYYDTWYSMKELGFKTDFPDQGYDEFAREEDHIQRTINHEQLHVTAAKTWHDDHQDAIKSDLETSCQYASKLACDADRKSRLERWRGEFDAWNKQDFDHDTPEWKGKPKDAPRERKPR